MKGHVGPYGSYDKWIFKTHLDRESFVLKLNVVLLKAKLIQYVYW